MKLEFSKPCIVKLGKASEIIMGNILGGYSDNEFGKRRTRPPVS